MVGRHRIVRVGDRQNSSADGYRFAADVKSRTVAVEPCGGVNYCAEKVGRRTTASENVDTYLPVAIHHRRFVR